MTALLCQEVFHVPQPYLCLPTSWPAGWMRCGSIRRCLDDFIFLFLKWPVELCTLFLQLNARVARWWGQIVIDLILSFPPPGQTMMLDTKQDLFHSEALKSLESTSALRCSLCMTGKEFEQFGSNAFDLWHQNCKNFQQETSTCRTLLYLQDLLSD